MHMDMYIHALVKCSAAPRMTEIILELKSKLKKSTFVWLLTVKHKEILKDFLLLGILKYSGFLC